jgi:hypothetical protein
MGRPRSPVISAERRESAHVGELPKKWATRKLCAEGANVFTVRVWDSRFGKTYYLPQVVDLAPVHPTVLSSEGAEVEHTHWRKVTKFENIEQPGVRQIASIDSLTVNIHTCRYVR